MNQRLLIPDKKTFGVAYARKLNLLCVLTRAGVSVYEVATANLIAELKCVNAPTDICFDDENKYMYILDSLGDLYKYDLQKVIKGSEDALIKEQPFFEILNMCRSMYYLKDDLILGIGTTCDYLLDVEAERKDKIYDVDDDGKKKSNYRYFDKDSGVLTVVISGDSYSVEEREYLSHKFNCAIPIDVVTVKSDKFDTTLAEGYQIMMEKKGSGLLKKNAPIMIKSDDFTINGEIDKKQRKLLNQDYIYQTTIMNDNILVLNTFKAMILIILDEKHPDFAVIDNVYGQFEKIDEKTLLFCMEKEGVVMITF